MHDASVLRGTWKEVVLFGPGGQESLAPLTSSIIREALREDVLQLFLDHC